MPGSSQVTHSRALSGRATRQPSFDRRAAVLLEWFDNASWSNADPLRVDRLANMLGSVADASAAAVAAVDRLRPAVADLQPATAGEDSW